VSQTGLCLGYILSSKDGPFPGLLNAVPALLDLTCELARTGRADKAEAKLHCCFDLGTIPAMEIFLINRNLDSEPT